MRTTMRSNHLRLRHLAIGCVTALAALLLARAPAAELVGPTLGFPLIVFDNMGSTAYDADSDLLLVLTRPLSLRLAADMAPVMIDPTDTLGELVNIAIRVDETGAVTGGVPGDDLAVTGQVDLDGDGLEDFAGLLLTGEVVAFGYSDSGGTTDQYDFVFHVSGGLLATLFAGSDVGVVVTSEFSSFEGDFGTSFAGEAKGTLGSALASGSLGDFVWDDLDGNGIQDPGEPGIADVELTLSADTDGDEVDDLLLETTTDAEGAYLFDGLPLGVDLQVAIEEANFEAGGPLEGLSPSPAQQGGDPALDSSTSPVVVQLSAEAPSDPTIDFGFTEVCGLDLAATCQVLGDAKRKDCRGDVEHLVFEYTAEGCDGTTNDQYGHVTCEGGADGASPVDVVVRDEHGDVIGDFGDVVPGDRIAVPDAVAQPASAFGGDWGGSGGDGGIGRRIEISVDGSLEVVSLVTSCWKPLDVGDAFGSFRLVEITSTRGGTVTLPAPGEGPTTCEVEGAPPPPHCVGRIEVLGLRYLGGSCDETTNPQSGEARCVGDADDTRPVHIVVTDGRGSKAGFGDDVVDPGDGGEDLPPDMAEDYEDAAVELDRCESKLAAARQDKKSASSAAERRAAVKAKKKWKKRTRQARKDMAAVMERISAWADSGNGSVPPGLAKKAGQLPPGLARKGGWIPPGHRPGKPGHGNSFEVLFDSGEPASIELGDVFEVDAADIHERKLPPQMIVEVYADDGSLVQKLLVHTSCSEPLNLGDRFGSVEVVSLDTTERPPVALGQDVEITYTLANPNAFDVFDVTLMDDLFGVVPGSPVATLASGGQSVLSATAFVTESIENTAVATALDGAGGQCGPVEAVTKLVVVPAEPSGSDHDHDDDD